MANLEIRDGDATEKFLQAREPSTGVFVTEHDSNLLLPSTSGFAPSRARSTALSTTPFEVKSSAGNLYGINAINVNSSAVYLKFYNTAVGSVTVGSTAVVLTICVPGGSSTDPGVLMFRTVHPWQHFSTAIAVACVTGLADSNTTAPSTAIHASFAYS